MTKRKSSAEKNAPSPVKKAKKAKAINAPKNAKNSYSYFLEEVRGGRV